MNKLAVLGSKIKKPIIFVELASFLVFGLVSLGFLNQVSYACHRTVMSLQSIPNPNQELQTKPPLSIICQYKIRRWQMRINLITRLNSV